MRWQTEELGGRFGGRPRTEWRSRPLVGSCASVKESSANGVLTFPARRRALPVQDARQRPLPMRRGCRGA